MSSFQSLADTNPIRGMTIQFARHNLVVVEMPDIKKSDLREEARECATLLIDEFLKAYGYERSGDIKDITITKSWMLSVRVQRITNHNNYDLEPEMYDKGSYGIRLSDENYVEHTDLLAEATIELDDSDYSKKVGYHGDYLKYSEKLAEAIHNVIGDDNQVKQKIIAEFTKLLSEEDNA